MLVIRQQATFSRLSGYDRDARCPTLQQAVLRIEGKIALGRWKLGGVAAIALADQDGPILGLKKTRNPAADPAAQ